MLYRIRQTSPSLYMVTAILTTLTGLCLLVFLIASKLILNGKPVIVLLIMLPAVILAFILPKYTSTAEFEISMDDKGMKGKWLKQFIFHTKTDAEIDWLDIEDFVFEPQRQFDKFKISLKDGTQFKFFHNSDDNKKDAFIQFLKDFEEKVKEINTSNDLKSKIKKGKIIYETNWGLVLAVFSMLIIVGVPILLITIHTKKTPNYAGIGIAYAGAIFFLTQVIIHRLKN